MNEHDHIRASFRFLQHAELFITERDDLARSEMLWCAAAHSVKAFAVQRGWHNDSHDDLFDVAGRINGEIGYLNAYFHFNAAGKLHRNMYRGFMNRRQLASDESHIREFVNRIAAAVNAYAPADGTPPAAS